MPWDTHVDIGTLITSHPDIQGGLPCIAGTRIPVLQVAVLYQEGLTVEEIAEEVDGIPLSHVYAAVAYYLANREQIDAEIQAEARLYERLALESPEQAPPP